MEDLRKAAVFLLTLDKPVAAEVLSQLPAELVEKVTLEMARLEGVTRDEQQMVVREFKIDSRDIPMEGGGLEGVEELLQQSLGVDRAGVILAQLKQTMSSVPFGFLTKSGAENLMTFIVEEHPQTIALVMSHLPAALAADVLAGLPSNKQIDVVRRVANMEQTNPEVVREVELSLERRLTTTFNQQLEKAGGVEAVAQILNVTDRTTNKGILDSLEQDDAELVDEIRRLMFVFDDLLSLDGESMRALLKEVDTAQWATALKGASEELQQKVLGNLSQRAADLLREEMDYLGPVRLSDVEAIQQQIVDTVRRLEDSGVITVGGGGDGEQFVQ